MKRSEVTVDRLRALGFRGYVVTPSKGGPYMDTLKDDAVLETIVNAAQAGRELVFQESIYFGHITVHEKGKPEEYIRRNMNQAELENAEKRLARMGIKPRWKGGCL